MEKKRKELHILAFDADDTLWDNEIFFREVEEKFGAMLENYLPVHSAHRALLKTEIDNIAIYGYGIKAFMLSMVETAIQISDYTLPSKVIDDIIILGKEMLDKPVTLLPDAEEVLRELSGKYKLVVATKGDLLDQERKLKKSGLMPYFHHIEIMTEKAESDYQKLIKHLDIPAGQFLMVGNSLKSDIRPVLNIGGHGIHIPYHTTWVYEAIDTGICHENFHQVGRLSDLLNLL
ncbi:MAG: HAD family hydrolase [Saprospiraceae bacterium]|nr:HAD family hydrolase [Saprospiraceae bacterium]